jgi:hypothetical protein
LYKLYNLPNLARRADRNRDHDHDGSERENSRAK